jgi:ketosteroid isomerase-like protein
MKKMFMVLPLVLLLCFTFGCQQGEEVAEEPAVDIAAETESVKEAFWSWLEAGPENGIDWLMSFLADDIISVGETMLDKAGMRERYEEIFSQGSYWTNQSLVKVVVSTAGDLAYTIVSSEFVSIVEGETQTSKRGNIVIWGKQADGSWKIVAF